MSTINFEWRHEWITPRMLVAVGAVVLEWSDLDNEIISLCYRFWGDLFPGERVPRSFDMRANGLMERARTLYAEEPDELRLLAWYLQRLRTANGKRDDLCHGIPGKVTKAGREFECLMVPFPSRETKFKPMTLDDVEQLARTLGGLKMETRDVRAAFGVALDASSGKISTWQDPDGWTPLTMANRSPKLPQWNLPPATFRV